MKSQNIASAASEALVAEGEPTTEPTSWQERGPHVGGPRHSFDIAGKGIAHYEGMTESIVLAGKFGKQIKAHDLATANA